MEIAGERASTAHEEEGHCQPFSFNVPPFIPTHHLRDGLQSFTEFLLRNVEEWSKPPVPWPPPPPPIAFSGSNRFFKGLLPHRTIAISASLSSLLDDAAIRVLDVRNHGDVHAVHTKTHNMTHDDTLSKMSDATHGDDDRLPATSTHCNTLIHIASLDNAPKYDETDGTVQGLSSNGIADVSACSTDNSQVNAACMWPQDGSSVSANEMAEVASCDTYKILPANSQCAHGSDDVTVQILHEDDGKVQPLNIVGMLSISPDGLDCSLSTTKDLDDKNYLHMKGCLPSSKDSLQTVVSGGKAITEALVDVAAGHSLPLECESSLPSSILTGNADGLAEFSLPSPMKSYNDNNFTGDTDGIAKRSFPSPSKSRSDSKSKGDISAVPELSLSPTTKSCDDNNLLDDPDGVTELSLPSPTRRHYLNNVTCDAEELAPLSLLSPRKSANISTCDAEGVAELQFLPATKSHNVNILQHTVMETPIVLQQDDQVEDLEEGELSERFPDDKCLETSENGNTIEDCESHPLNATRLEPRAVECTTDDEMNQPISLFISRYRTRSSVNPSTQKMPTLNAISNLKKKRETGNKRTIKKQEQMLKEIIGTDMAVTGKSRQAKGVLKGPSKVARACASVSNDYNGGGLLGVVSKVSIVSNVDASEAKDNAEKKYAELGPTQAGRDQVMGTLATVLSEREDGALHTHGKGLTQPGGAGSEHFAALEVHVSMFVSYIVNSKLALTCTLSVVCAHNGHSSGSTGCKDMEFDKGLLSLVWLLLMVLPDGTLVSSLHESILWDIGVTFSVVFVFSDHKNLVEEKPKVCLPMVVEEGLSTIDAGNDQTFSQAEVAMKKPKCRITAERKKKRQQIKHRKTYERKVLGIRKLSLKPCVDKQKEKKACHHYTRGKCSKGASCPFSHDVTPITKSEMCKYFINKCCLKGDDCPYSHALSTFPCKFFHTRGKCMEADSCRFSHEPISEEAKQKLLTKVEQEQQVREGNKLTESGGFGRINPKHSALPSDLELFPLGGKRANKTPLMGKGVAATKKAPSTLRTSINATNFDGNKSLFRGGSQDPTGPLADKSGEKSTTPTTTALGGENGGLLAQATGFSSNSTMTQERKTKVDAFLQAQLDNSPFMRKSKLGTGLENFGGCYTLSNQPRAISMGQTSPLKAPNISPSRDPNAKAMGLLHAFADCSQLIPTLKPTICVNTTPNSNFSIDQWKRFSNGKSIGIDASVPNPSVMGPSLLDIVSTSQRPTVPKGPASTSGLVSTTDNVTPKRSTANVFLDRFLKG